uniref:Cytochrome P450 n=1 Tax=Kalanchoe fedtschenkoi TaxID=63787 RepID=A0A7N0RCF2_KALFE
MELLVVDFSSYGAVVAYSFYSFTVFFSLFSIILYLLRLTKPLCNCDTCRAYLHSTWASDFPNLCDWYTHLISNSPTATIHIHVLNNTITANPDNVEYMVKTNFDNFPKGKPFRSILGDLLGDGIFNVDGEGWRFQRKMASLELGSVSIRSFAFDIIASEIRTRLLPLLADKTTSGAVMDMQDVFRRFSFDNICRFSFGLDPGCLEMSLSDSNFAAAFDLATRLSAQRAMTPSPLVWKIKRAFNLGSEKDLSEAIKLVNTVAEEVIKQKRSRSRALPPDTQNDLLSRFMHSVDDDRYLRDIVVSFMLAGRDTVASVLTAFFHLIMINPHVEKRIRSESDRVLGSSSSEPATFEQMREMHYLQASIYETMRLLPPVQFDSKFVLTDDVLPDGTFVSKGTRVTYHPYAMGRMESIWGPDAMRFRPERWLQSDGVFKPANPFKYPVFHAGPRICLGKELAVMTSKSVALALIRRFSFRAAEPGKRAVFAPGLTTTFRGGLPVRISERTVPW